MDDNPKLIIWKKEEGVFRPAKLKMPENYLGYDLERNVELEEPVINPDLLNLVSSIYLGPINIFEEQSSRITSTKDLFERLRQFKHGIAYGIVELAKEVAKRQGVPYFGVNVVESPKDRTWKFTERENIFRENYHVKLPETYSIFDFLKSKDKPKPLELVLHPTAQLYVLRTEQK